MNNQRNGERRLQTQKLAQELLEKRLQVWALHERLVMFPAESGEPGLDSLLSQFCQELIDYISLEHFGIFYHLVNGLEKRAKMLALAEAVFPCLSETTDAALSFNDKYEILPGRINRGILIDDLSRLSDALAARVNLEDRLIDGMLA